MSLWYFTARRRNPSAAACLIAALVGLAGCGQGQNQATSASASQTVPPAVTRAPAPTSAPVAPAPVAPAPVIPASAPAAPQSTYTLMLTWLTPDQPPTTTQTAFHDAASCGRARDAALAEGQRIATDTAATFAAATAKYAAGEHHYVGRTLLSGDAPPTAPTVPKVSAFCVGA